MLTHLKLGLKHPAAAMMYILRNKLWLKELGMTKDEISMYAKELIEEGLLKNMSKELGQDVSDKRQVELYPICRHLKPEIVVETGVQNGISTTFILAALEKTIRESFIPSMY